MPMHARAQRLARGWIVGLVATTIAAVSHSIAGGYRPGALSFGVALIFAGLLGTAVIGCRPSLPRLAIAVGGSQLAFHLMFSMLGSGAAAAGSSAVSGMPGMGGMSLPVAPAVAMSGTDHLADPSMWCAHAVAAALTIAFLRHAELSLWTMLTRAIGRIVLVGIPLVAARPPVAPAASPTVASLTSRVLVASASRRGPPLLAF